MLGGYFACIVVWHLFVRRSSTGFALQCGCNISQQASINALPMCAGHSSAGVTGHTEEDGCRKMMYQHVGILVIGVVASSLCNWVSYKPTDLQLIVAATGVDMAAMVNSCLQLDSKQRAMSRTVSN